MKRLAEKQILAWKDAPRRKPLIIRGARQVGKTFEVDITSAVNLGAPNVLAVRVEDRRGAGGIWKPVLIVTQSGTDIH